MFNVLFIYLSILYYRYCWLSFDGCIKKRPTETCLTLLQKWRATWGYTGILRLQYKVWTHKIWHDMVHLLVQGYAIHLLDSSVLSWKSLRYVIKYSANLDDTLTQIFSLATYKVSATTLDYCKLKVALFKKFKG